MHTKTPMFQEAHLGCLLRLQSAQVLLYSSLTSCLRVAWFCACLSAGLLDIVWDLFWSQRVMGGIGYWEIGRAILMKARSIIEGRSWNAGAHLPHQKRSGTTRLGLERFWAHSCGADVQQVTTITKKQDVHLTKNINDRRAWTQSVANQLHD